MPLRLHDSSGAQFQVAGESYEITLKLYSGVEYAEHDHPFPSC